MLEAAEKTCKISLAQISF